MSTPITLEVIRNHKHKEVESNRLSIVKRNTNSNGHNSHEVTQTTTTSYEWRKIETVINFSLLSLEPTSKRLNKKTVTLKLSITNSSTVVWSRSKQSATRLMMKLWAAVSWARLCSRASRAFAYHTESQTRLSSLSSLSSEHVSGAGSERKTERSGPKMEWLGAKRWAGVREKNGAGAERGAGCHGGGTQRWAD